MKISNSYIFPEHSKLIVDKREIPILGMTLEHDQYETRSDDGRVVHVKPGPFTLTVDVDTATIDSVEHDQCWSLLTTRTKNKLLKYYAVSESKTALWDMSLQQLLSIPGISHATVAEIARAVSKSIK